MSSGEQQNRIWLSPPHLGGQEQQYLDAAISENWIAPAGPQIDRFEGELENYIGYKKYAAALNSGTAAIHLALILAGVTKGDEVICQTLTFAASANPIKYLEATPVFVDSEQKTWNICPVLLEEAIKDRIAHGKKPKAIIAVHLYGMPYQVDEVLAVAKKYKIPVIEDAAEALGSSYDGQSCGNFGKYAIFSFNGNKIITTGGGGALLTNTEDEKEEAIFLATQAKDQALHFEHSQLGYNYRMSNIAASIGCGQMEVLAERISQKREINSWYRELFTTLNIEVQFQDEPSDTYFSNYWLTVVQLDENVRDRMISAFAEANIECRPVWKPMHLQPLYKDCTFYSGAVAENLFKNGLCLPSGTNMTAENRERIVNCLKTIL